MTITNAAVAIDINIWRAGLPRPNWWSAPWSEIANLIILPNGTLLADDAWTTPKGWGHRCSSLDFTKALPARWHRKEPRAQALLRRLKRLAAIDFTVSVRGSSNKPFGPGHWNTWLGRNRSLHAAAKAVAENPQGGAPTRCPDGDPLFAALSPAALEDVLPDASWSRYKLVSRLNALFAAGVIDDWPVADVAHQSHTPRRRGDPNITQPYSDQSFTTLCQAAFTMAALQEDFLACYQQISAIEVDDQGRRDSRYMDPYRQARLAEWTGTYLSRGVIFGLTLFIKERTGSPSSDNLRTYNAPFSAWPLRTLGQIHQALRLCQVANWIILAAATGARAGELEALTRDALIDFVPARWGGDAKELALLTGRTFKTEAFAMNRQWPLPRQAAEAFGRQRKLAQELAPGGESLWIARNDKERVSLHDRLKYFCEAVSLDGEHPIKSQIEGSVHAQRFRETLSRLVGLCLDNGHHVLFDVLGHREMDTTIGYMMSDLDFAAQARRVRHEAEMVRKRRIIGNADTLGGPAAKEIVRLRNTVAKQAFGDPMDLDKPGSADVAARVAEFAEIMSNEEIDTILPHATVVRSGIYCVANEAQPGLCSKSTVRDVSRCSPYCHHRLEEAAAIDDRRRSVRYILEKMDERKMPSLQRTFYQRQLLDQFAATPKLFEEFSNDRRLHPALANITPGRIALLPDDLRTTLKALLGEVS